MNKIIPEFNHTLFRAAVDIIQVREALDWSQDRMAAHMGCHQSKISRWESGHSVIAKLAMQEYWRLFHELGLHEKQSGASGTENHGEHA